MMRTLGVVSILMCVVVTLTSQQDTVSVPHSEIDGVCEQSGGAPCTSNDTPKFRAKLPFTYTPIPRYHHTDPKAWQAMENQVPAIIYGRPIFKTDIQWDLQYMAERLRDIDETWSVAVHDGPVFKDFDEDNNYANYKWVKEYGKLKLAFRDFVQLHEELTKADNGTRAYIQSYLTDARMGSNAVYRLDQLYIDEVRSRYGWGQSSTNFILLAMKDCMTPMHHDNDENLFQQIFGHKRFIMFHPDHFGDIYPHPVHHARNRYTMVDFENPDYKQFPRFRNLEKPNEAHLAIVGPGDTLYVPTNWWHMVEASSDGDSLSMATRFVPREMAYYRSYDTTMDLGAVPQRDGRVLYKSSIDVNDPFTGKSWNIQKPDGDIPLIFMRRVVENFIAEATGSYRKVPEILHEILDGRFDSLEFSDEDPI